MSKPFHPFRQTMPVSMHTSNCIISYSVKPMHTIIFLERFIQTFTLFLSLPFSVKVSHLYKTIGTTIPSNIPFVSSPFTPPFTIPKHLLPPPPNDSPLLLWSPLLQYLHPKLWKFYYTYTCTVSPPILWCSSYVFIVVLLICSISMRNNSRANLNLEHG